jgi:hypothetical protein
VQELLYVKANDKEPAKELSGKFIHFNTSETAQYKAKQLILQNQ